MINLAITSTQSKAARAALGISQSKVAQATGINRRQLALFEVQKYLLPQARLKTLRAYYGGLGYEFDAPRKKATRSEDDSREVAESAAQSDAKVIDRFLVPVGLADDTLESLIEEIDANDRRLDELAQQETEIDWVS